MMMLISTVLAVAVCAMIVFWAFKLSMAEKNRRLNDLSGNTDSGQAPIPSDGNSAGSSGQAPDSSGQASTPGAAGAAGGTAGGRTRSGAAPGGSAPTGAGSSSQSIGTACGVVGMPEGVCTAMNSIEQSGVKNSPYVDQTNAASLPDGVTVSINKSSWSMQAVNQGTASFTAQYNGQTYTGVATFNNASGSWRAVSVVLNQ